jgi:hypothetical protein
VKKFLVILTLALALCMLCAVALADQVYKVDYEFRDYDELNGAIQNEGDPHHQVLVSIDGQLTPVELLAIDEKIVYSGTENHEKPAHVRVISKKVENGADGYLILDCTVLTTHTVNWWTDDSYPATCNEDGMQYMACEDCDWTDEQVLEKTGKHLFELKETKAPTCVTLGEYEEICTVCGTPSGEKKITGNVYLNGTKEPGHYFPTSDEAEYNMRKYWDVKAPQCDPETRVVGDGYVDQRCIYCLKTHEAVKTETMKQDGEAKKEVGTSDYVDFVFNTLKEQIDPNYDGHDWDNWIDRPATCFLKNGKERWCKRCADFQYVEDKDGKYAKPVWKLLGKEDGEGIDCWEVPASDATIVCAICEGRAVHPSDDAAHNGIHMYENCKIEEAATGSKTGTDVMGQDYVISQKVQVTTSDGILLFTAFANHDWQEVPNTRTEYWVNDPEFKKEIDARDRSNLVTDFSDPEIYDPCEIAVYAQFHCVNECGTSDVYLVVEKAPDHDWSDWELAYDGEGKTETDRWARTCNVCGKRQVIAKSEKPVTPCKPGEHEWVEDPENDYSDVPCGEEVVVNMICLVCKAKAPANECKKIKIEHQLTEEIITEATCTKAGRKLITCAREACKDYPVVEAIPMIPHTEEEIPAVASTCNRYGTTAGKKCSVCGTILEAPVALTTLGEHVFGEAEVVKVATCKEAGKVIYTCEVCGAVKAEAVAKLTDHPWDDGVVTKEATPTENGEKLYTCPVCGETKTEEIPFEPTKPTTYTLKDLAYDSPIVKGVAVFDEYSIPVEKAYYRVTFFMADGSFIIAADAIGADGSFSTLCDAEVVHISVEIVDKKDCLLPETFKVYGAAAAYDAAE